jgi:hypothetical protein
MGPRRIKVKRHTRRKRTGGVSIVKQHSRALRGGAKLEKPIKGKYLKSVQMVKLNPDLTFLSNLTQTEVYLNLQKSNFNFQYDSRYWIQNAPFQNQILIKDFINNTEFVLTFNKDKDIIQRIEEKEIKDPLNDKKNIANWDLEEGFGSKDSEKNWEYLKNLETLILIEKQEREKKG